MTAVIVAAKDMASRIAPRLAIAHERRARRDLAKRRCRIARRGVSRGLTKDTGRAWLPISMSGMIDTPVSINSLVTGKGGDSSFALIWSRRSADWSRGINASPSKRVYIGAGHKAVASCLRCKPSTLC
jgi:hypothetical protein